MTETWAGQSVSDIMLGKPKTLPADASVGTVRELFENPRVQMALLVEGAGLFRGAVTRDDIPQDAAPEAQALPFAGPATPVARDASAQDTFDEITRHPSRRLVVLGDDGETLLGLVCLNSRRTGFCSGS